MTVLYAVALFGLGAVSGALIVGRILESYAEDDEVADALRWEDDNGRVRWQPQLDTGERLWVQRGHFEYRWASRRSDIEDPKLYWWRWRAVSRARREERRRARQFRPEAS